jgi:hypothetical protein
MLFALIIPVVAIGWLGFHALGIGGAAGEGARASRPKLTSNVYQRAAATCPGLPWTVLGAIHAIESRRGNSAETSGAGARGPMQFLPATWAAFGVDGDGDGRADIDNPIDAVYGAARYLCATGGGDPAGLAGAIWNYNHSDEYVDLVLRVSDEIRTGGLPAATRALDGSP